MARKYKVVENPPPGKRGISTITEMNTDTKNILSIGERFNSNRNVDIPLYNVVQRVAPLPPRTIVNNTIINQEITINNSGTAKVAAEYFHSLPINNITTRTQIINNGAGLGTYDDNTLPIWNVNTSTLSVDAPKKFFEIILSFTLTTDTLGGAFEIEAYNGTSIEIIEEDITIQQQDFTTRFRIISDNNSITNGIRFFITPELGMKINITNFSILIIKE